LYSVRTELQEPSTEETGETSRRQLKSIRAASKYPVYKNWYKEGKVTRPYEQGSCGGCWAFSCTAAVESLAAINNVEKHITEYSVQQVIDCCEDNLGCTGGWMYQGLQYIGNNGVLPKTEYATYSQMQHACEAKKYNNEQKGRMSGIGYIEKDARDNDELREIL
jgi:C1A family cysteine protease